MTASAMFSDSDLVAFVHGELDAARAEALRAALAREPELRARHDLLSAADAALREALATDQAPGRTAPRRIRWSSLLAAAAVCVVAAVFVLGRAGDDAAAARNDFVELRMAPRGGASHPLFTEAALELRWRNRGDGKDWKYLSVGSYAFGDTLEALGKARHSIETLGKIVPLVVSATLRAPDGTTLPARLRPASAPLLVGDTEIVQTVMPHDFEVQTGNPRPYLGGRPGTGEWVDDFMWVYRQMPHGQQPRWFPDQPGEWRIELRVECVPPPEPGTSATFAEPLVVTTSLWLTGEVSAWGDEHDGLRARLVRATGCADFDRTPVAIQIENRSGRTRKYNVTGHTIAAIPQPFHFTLCASPRAESPGKQLVQCYAQPGGVAAVTSTDDLMVPHPDGTIRTLVVRPSYWHGKEPRLVDEPGEHQIWFELHFEPSLWIDGDMELWMGKLRTGRLPVDVPSRR